MNDFGLYVIITNPSLPYETIARICVEQQISFLQLREKKLADNELISVGRSIMAITKGSKTKLVINDRPDIAAVIGADGYHLGQDDISLREAKKIYPEACIKGLSTHNLEQVRQAIEERPDYIGFGPIYSTPTKEKPDPVTGTQQLTDALALIDQSGIKLPVVAIGGIDEHNLRQVLEAGASNFALVRYLMQTTEIEKRIQKIKQLAQNRTV